MDHINTSCPHSIEEAAQRGKTRKSSPKSKRGVASLRLGCKPFKRATVLYLEDCKGGIKESTWKERRKKLNFIGRVLEHLYVEGKIKTLDPRHLSTSDVLAFKGWMMSRNYDPSTQKKLLGELKGMLKQYDNHVFDQLLRKGVKMPRSNEKPIRTFDEDSLYRILEATYYMKNEWHGKMMRGAFALYWATMRRPTEIRLRLRSDLDLGKMRLHIDTPKGAGSWTGPVDVDIVRLDMMDYLEQYQLDRAEYLKANGREDIGYLFPNIHSKTALTQCRRSTV